MDIDTLGWIIVLVAGIASAIVGNFNPKKDGFWYKVRDILNYISIFNPRGTINISYDDYRDYRKYKMDKKDNDEFTEYRE